MNVGELHALFRSQIDDAEAERLLTRTEFLDYLNEAVEEACVRRDLLYEASASFCTVNLAEGQPLYPLHCSFYALKHAEIDGYPLGIRDRAGLDAVDCEWRSRTGQPKYLVQGDTSILVAPTPDKAYALKVEGYRLPLQKLADNGDCPEIHKHHHRNLIYWVQYRAYSIPDADIYDTLRADLFLAQFERIYGRPVYGTNKRDWHVPHIVAAHY